MSVDFRQRTPSEYARIIWRRKWLLLLPTIAITTAFAWVVSRLPAVYESTTLIVVKPAVIPNSVVPPLSDTDLTLRLNNISQEVASRTSLQTLIERYNLYALERRRGEPTELLVERMRRDIAVLVERGREERTSGFRITYRGNDRRVTQAIAAELANKYVNAQTSDTANVSTSTKQFFQKELDEVKSELDEIERRRMQFMQQNVGNLPSENGALIGQLAGLREQQRTLITEMGRMRDQQTALSSQLNELTGQSEIDREEIVEGITDPKTTPGYVQLMQQETQYEAELKTMLTTLREKNPEVIAKRSQLESTQRAMARMIEENEAKVEARKRRLADRIDPRISGLKVNLKLNEGEYKRQQSQLDLISRQVAEIEGRLNRVPGAEVVLGGLEREYGTKKAEYDQLQSKNQGAELAANVAINAQGETIQVIDPASLPERPVAPNRPMLIGLGFALGFAVGLLLAVAFEVPRLLTVQTTADAEHYTGMSVLVSVPELLTPQEERRRKLGGILLVAASIAATIVSIPALAFLLKTTRILEALA